jgi:hypothetical protein
MNAIYYLLKTALHLSIFRDQSTPHSYIPHQRFILISSTYHLQCFQSGLSFRFPYQKTACKRNKSWADPVKSTAPKKRNASAPLRTVQYFRRSIPSHWGTEKSTRIQHFIVQVPSLISTALNLSRYAHVTICRCRCKVEWHWDAWSFFFIRRENDNTPLAVSLWPIN